MEVQEVTFYYNSASVEPEQCIDQLIVHILGVEVPITQASSDDSEQSEAN